MAKEVELKLVVNNNTAVNSVRELATESKKLYDNNEKAQKRQVGLIADIENELAKLQKAQKNAMSIEQIEKYNRKIAEAKQGLEEYNKAGLAVEKQGNTLMQTFGKWALSIGVVTTALGLLKEAFLKTQGGMIIFNQAGAAMKQVLSNIVNGVQDWNAGVVQSMVLAKQMALLRIQDKRDSIEINKLLRDYNDLYQQGMDQTLKGENRLKLLTEAKGKFIEATENEILSTKRQLKVASDMWKNAPTDIEAEGKVLELYNRILELQRDLSRGTMRITSAITGEIQRETEEHAKQLKTIHEWGLDLQKAFLKDEQDAQKKANDKKLKIEKDYQDAVKALIERYVNLDINAKTGVEKLKALRAQSIAEITKLRKELAAFGPITPAQQAMILKMVDDVQTVFVRGMGKEAKITPAQKDRISKALLSVMPTKEDLAKAPAMPDKATKPIESIWELIGIDPESDEGKEQMDQIKKAVSTTLSAMDEIYDAKVEDAERLRQLAQDRVSDAETALNTEVELFKAGYASNVAAKQKELDDLKEQRDIAQKNEEAAVKQQRAFDTVSQVSSLVTAAAQTLSKLNGPLLPIGIALVAAMFAAFALAKTKAANITKLGSGGRGDVGGRLHSEGGERFLDHVEIEQGEKWGVLSRNAARKYGSTFNMMVDSFNRDSLSIPKQGVINNILLDTSMTNTRLDELITLNKKEKKEEIIVMNGMTIYKKGNSTRVIKR